jgi:hypothetical protein
LQEAEAVADFAMDEAEKNDQLDILRLKAQIQASRGQFKSAVESFRVLLATIQVKKEVWKSTTCNEVQSPLLYFELQQQYHVSSLLIIHIILAG